MPVFGLASFLFSRIVVRLLFSDPHGLCTRSLHSSGNGWRKPEGRGEALITQEGICPQPCITANLEGSVVCVFDGTP